MKRLFLEELCTATSGREIAEDNPPISPVASELPLLGLVIVEIMAALYQ